MAVGLVDRQKLVNIADAVREKKGITGNMTLDAIASNITSMPKFDFAGSGSKSSGILVSYLTTVDLSNLDTSNYTSMTTMFQDCSSLTSLDLSNFDTSKVTGMIGMFSDCSSLTSLDVSNFNTSKVTNMGNMFSNCSSLTSLDLSNFDTSNVTGMDGMFNRCLGLTSLDLSNFNTSKVTNLWGMFKACTSLTNLDLSNWNTSKVTSMKDMFGNSISGNCSKLTNLTLGNDWASNSKITSFNLSYCPLTHESAVDVINKLATRSNSPVITFSNQVELYKSEIDVATNKGWSVSGCTVLEAPVEPEAPPTLVEDPTTATVGQRALIDGVMSMCVYVADTPQDWGQRIFASQSEFTDSNGNSEYQWGGSGTATGITATAIGTGLTNTDALLAMNLKSTDGTPTIWDALAEFRSTHSNRWFIPSRDEGLESYKQGMREIWTSSEYDSSDAYLTYEHNHNNTAKEKFNMAFAFTYV